LKHQVTFKRWFTLYFSRWGNWLSPFARL